MPKAKFVSGSILSHIFLMTTTNALGLTALFLVDLADLYFISLLGQAELAAAVGYAGSIAFFTTSLSIGLSITMTALVAKAIGQKKRLEAGQLVTNTLVTGFMLSAVVAALTFYYSEPLLELLGAKGETLNLANDYLRILLPSLPILGLGMSAGAALRSIGDARRAMWSTLIGGAINAALDPLFIFGFGWDLQGAALASVMARFGLAGIALWGVIRVHKLIAPFSMSRWLAHQKRIFAIAVPAMMTNVATPFGNAYVTAAIAGFGDSYVAGWAVIGRVIPVAFGMIFSLSGAVGPIIGQNFGALKFERVRQALHQAMGFAFGYVALISVVVFLLREPLVNAFGITGEGRELVLFFCVWICFSFVFNGALFVSNAALNNIGYPMLSTLMNVGKATIGTVPFVYFASQIGGAIDILIAQAIGTVVFGIGAYALAFYMLAKVKVKQAVVDEEANLQPQMPMTAFCSSRAYMASNIDTNDAKSLD
ncbi:MATE family efflux transporter [Alginatibacterium sediminis]|uniref:Multidrug-efflux transporter n=1 Tax=Alginatibacterium sediminis TaxID=2164068 RepID=A0A420E9Y8_9ALTE|nr:MATE family efflux transporter [Alginatibacterium sediminis]RKF17485.1 MATE family efflux transporter [Alginatibacterium sediminis]